MKMSKLEIHIDQGSASCINPDDFRLALYRAKVGVDFHIVVSEAELKLLGSKIDDALCTCLQARKGMNNEQHI